MAMFQALKHRVADLKIMIGGAEALLWSEAARGTISLTRAGGLKAHATEVYRFVCEEEIQLHGGGGLTDELYCHLFMKRANLNVQLGGAARLIEGSLMAHPIIMVDHVLFGLG